MQQFTVPQFIDVESKIIGPLTTRQFLIILGTVIIIAINYKIFDFSLFVVSGILLIIIAFVFSFVKINGRPFHFFVLNAFQTLRRPGLRIWNNRLTPQELDKKIASLPAASLSVPSKMYKQSRLSELALIVDTKGKYKGE
jgi:hypothetical protein